MTFAGPLRQEEDQEHDGGRKDGGGQRSAEFEAALSDGLIEEVSYGGAERSGQDERRPEQERAGYDMAEVKQGQNPDRRAEEERRA